ncbi:Wzz/FepE/Etk N-terminal domain-containing protein [Pseudomonas sp. M30-35]|uniref:Wzz/FepE/Etk N-terminal domain-containing protein n=1 Tax=Pseudomonas sp. M30-35 TaxID=1981174 RepID=UPI00211443EE|nr:Wzz/FepE/Etk N-terminal domain-containing protein [Pseudomonas sp. M30-35]
MNARVSHGPESNSDEIDLFALINSLWLQRWLIAGVMALLAIAAGTYALLATPYYQAQSVLKPTSLKSFDQLNLTGVYKVDRDQVLNRIGISLESYSTRYDFFQKHPELFQALEQPGVAVVQAFERLNKSAFTILKPDVKKADSLSSYVGLSFVYPEGVDGPAVVNGLVAYAVEQERARIAAEVSTLVTNRLNKLQSQIAAARIGYEADKQSKIAKLLEADSVKRANLMDELAGLRQQLKLRRQNRIMQLTEAIMIAEQLNIHKPATPSSMRDLGEQASNNLIRTEVTNQQIPLYFMGTEALGAERKALRARASDDFTDAKVGELEKQLRILRNNREVEALRHRGNDDLFLSKLAKWEEETSYLQELKPELLLLDLVDIDQPAVSPLSPIKPKKLLIVVLGLVLGLMLGVFIALVRSMMTRLKPISLTMLNPLPVEHAGHKLVQQ